MENKYIVYNETTGKRIRSPRGQIFLSKSGANRLKVDTEGRRGDDVVVYKCVQVGTRASRLAPA